MNIEVKQELLDLIKVIEERERKTSGLELNFFWAYGADGNGASGESASYHAHAEYDLYINGDNSVTAQTRGLDKWSNEGWETDPLDSDYEEEEQD